MKYTFEVMLKEQILDDFKKILQKLNLPQIEPSLEHPAQEEHGDFASNVALVLWGRLKKEEWEERGFKAPLDLANKIADYYKSESKSHLAKIEASPPGFINFWLSEEFLKTQVQKIIEEKGNFGRIREKRGTVMVEFAHPNTHKAFHIGHLRNISAGESIVRLLEAVGYKVVRANYQGDVGMHIAKAIYALISIPPFKDDVLKVEGVQERVEFLGKAYAAGSRAFEEGEEAKELIKDINYLVYAAAQKFQEEKGVLPSSTDYTAFVHGRREEIEKVFKLWKETRQWSLDYFETVYQRVSSRFDRYYFESECLAGVDLVKEAVKKGVLKESDGAIIFDGKPYDLDIRVFVNNLGLPTYEAKELALAQKEFSEFGDLERVIHVVGPEQASFFKVTFKVEELLDADKYKDKQYHLIYGWVRLKHGKMSSRTGNVVLGEWLLDEVKSGIKKQFPQMPQPSAEEVAIGAVKYSFLKVGLGQDIAFDIEESISLEGNSGPYLQYTYARTQSVLDKSSARSDLLEENVLKRSDLVNINPEEMTILRALYKFPEIVWESVGNYAPNLVCSYLFDLAQKFNLFYQKHPILKSERGQRDFRLALTQTVGQIMENGLFLLGVSAPPKM